MPLSPPRRSKFCGRRPTSSTVMRMRWARSSYWYFRVGMSSSAITVSGLCRGGRSPRLSSSSTVPPMRPSVSWTNEPIILAGTELMTTSSCRLLRASPAPQSPAPRTMPSNAVTTSATPLLPAGQRVNDRMDLALVRVRGDGDGSAGCKTGRRFRRGPAHGRSPEDIADQAIAKGHRGSRGILQTQICDTQPFLAGVAGGYGQFACLGSHFPGDLRRREFASAKKHRDGLPDQKIDGAGLLARRTRQLVDDDTVAFLALHRRFGDADDAHDIVGVRRQFHGRRRCDHVGGRLEALDATRLRP